jgi:transposase
MDDTLLEQLRQSQERNETLSRELASVRAEKEVLRSENQSLHAQQQAQGSELASVHASLDRVLQEFGALRRDYEALVDATRIITDERNTLRQRVAELEAANNRLTDMLWGRRSERRSESPDQQHLDFGDGPAELPSAEEQEIITAQAEADEARDRELLKRLEARRKARREQSQGREEFPPTIERRERVLDLPEDQKQGLKSIGVKTTERLRFEKPHMYVEVIKRPQYVVAGQPEKGVQSMPPPLSIIEGCKYDFSVVAAMAGLKFAFHVPTYRQQDWFAQWGWFPNRSTVNDLLNYAVDTIGPLYQQMWQLLLAQPILLGDDDDTVRAVARRIGRGRSGETQHAKPLSSGVGGGPGVPQRRTRFGHQLRMVVHEPGRLGPLQCVSLVADASELGDRRASGHVSRHLRGRCLRRQCAFAAAFWRTDRSRQLQYARPPRVHPG